jgi:ribonuclease-3
MKGYNMELEVNLKYTFKNIELLNEALTHTSYANENNVNSNEKLEFFGDAILEFVSSKYLYANFPELSEGELTKTRAAVVCEDSLYEVAKKLKVNEFIKVGHSELNKEKMTEIKEFIQELENK